jgi:hypothetical protein
MLARKAKAKGRRSKARAKLAKKSAKSSKRAKKKGRRTVMYTSSGKKLYAKRDASGKFKDIQSYQRAHSMDIKRHDADDKDETPLARRHPGVRPPPKVA